METLKFENDWFGCGECESKHLINTNNPVPLFAIDLNYMYVMIMLPWLMASNCPSWCLRNAAVWPQFIKAVTRAKRARWLGAH